MIKIITVIGARPQFIKAAALSHEIIKHNNIEEIIVHTGQHFDETMSSVFFEELSIPQPKYNLGINSLSHGAMTGHMMIGLEKILLDEKPDLLLVYGDTNSTLAGALTSQKLHIPVAHVEAGLRSFNMNMPEEVNRILTDRISSILFCPTKNARENLINEGFASFKAIIQETGDIMLDSSQLFSKFIEDKAFDELPNKDFILLTLHRAENTDNPSILTEIVNSINLLAQSYKIVIPLHPRTKNKITELGLTLNCMVIDPVGYLEMIFLLKNCSLVITDSGGLQKEAFFFRKYCITLRNETEWIELVDNGYNTLIYKNFSVCLLNEVKKYYNKTIENAIPLYGEGDASRKIVEVIKDYFTFK